MQNKDDNHIVSFVDSLRQETEHGPGRGVKRFARMLRGGAGLAFNTFLSTRRGSDFKLGPRDLLKIEALVSRLGELKGLPMKMGQIMSYLELDMPEETRHLMSLLQTQAPATPWDQVESVVHEDLGKRAEELLVGLERSPVAIASIGQVYKGHLPDGSEVAVKVRHPEIEAAIRSDFRGASAITGMVSNIVPNMGATARDFTGEVEARLLEECDYALEAQRQQTFAHIYQGHDKILVPAVYGEWCGPRVLTTAWASGQAFEDFRQHASQQQRNDAGAALFDFYIGTLYRHGLFHADPHPGNYCFADDGKVIVFDYGCVRVFEPDVGRAFVAMANAVRADDREQVCAALRGLGAEPSNNDAAYDQLRNLLRSFFKPMLTPGAKAIDGRIVVDMGQVARDKLALARLRLPGRLMFLFRIRFGLYAVLSRLGSVCDWAEMEQSFAEQQQL